MPTPAEGKACDWGSADEDPGAPAGWDAALEVLLPGTPGTPCFGPLGEDMVQQGAREGVEAKQHGAQG